MQHAAIRKTLKESSSLKNEIIFWEREREKKEQEKFSDILCKLELLNFCLFPVKQGAKELMKGIMKKYILKLISVWRCSRGKHEQV